MERTDMSKHHGKKSEPLSFEGNHLLRLPAVERFSGLKRTQIWEHIARGEFPRPIKLTESGRAIAWDEAELMSWLEERRAARDAGAS
jgi:prophage regulatory protein